MPERSVTNLIRSAMDIQEQRQPDRDPGDVYIDIQDDSLLVTIFQRNVIVGMGATVEEAAQQFFEAVEAGETTEEKGETFGRG